MEKLTKENKILLYRRMIEKYSQDIYNLSLDEKRQFKLYNKTMKRKYADQLLVIYKKITKKKERLSEAKENLSKIA